LAAVLSAFFATLLDAVDYFAAPDNSLSSAPARSCRVAAEKSIAGDDRRQRVRLAANTDYLEQEIALLREESWIKDARMARIPANQRPHYLPTERLRILELRAARGWSLAQTSQRSR